MSEQTKIEVSLAVYKYIESHRKSFDQSRSQILEELLGIDASGNSVAVNQIEESEMKKQGLVLRNGVVLPSGTELRKRYKGNLHTAKVRDGAIWLGEKAFSDPSPAAMEITGSNVNGWRFWEIRLPNAVQWMSLDDYRNRAIFSKIVKTETILHQ